MRETTLTVRVRLVPDLSLRGAIALRIAGPRIRDAYANLLDETTKAVAANAHGDTP